jgi:cyclohexa-1,5-dienecarbonyl-CoA hydratase
MANAVRVPVVQYARANGVGRITLDRPKLNILDVPMLEALAAALEQARADGDLSVLALGGAGKAFCAGVDVAAHLPGRVEPTLRLFHDVVRRLAAFEAPTVALVHGAALGGGLELALACDFILTADEVALGQPEIHLGVLPPVAAARLPGRIGAARALDLVLTGRSVTGREALASGLADRCWPADQFAAQAEAFLTELAHRSRPVLRLAKRAVREGASLPFEPALARAEALYLGELMRCDDAHEGIAAFLEKRPPRWRHG